MPFHFSDRAFCTPRVNEPRSVSMVMVSYFPAISRVTERRSLEMYLDTKFSCEP